MPPARRGLSLLTLNVNGLNRPGKPAAFAQYAARLAGQPDVICLQEVKCADVSSFAALFSRDAVMGLTYYTHKFVSLGSDDSCGVAILAKAGVFNSTPKVATCADEAGRIVRVDVDLGQHKLSLVSVYAPNRAKTAFFSSTLPAHLPPDRVIIMAGDFNCILDPAADQTNMGSHRLEGSGALTCLMHNQSLSDAFRHLHPSTSQYTHVGTNGASAARLDRILLSASHTRCLREVRHVHGAPSDHSGVLMVLDLPGMPTLGPGMRTFPTYILYNTELRDRLTSMLVSWFEEHEPPPDDHPPGAAASFWAHLKDFLRSAGVAVATRHAREQRRLLQQAQQCVRSAEQRLAQQPSSVSHLTAYRNAIEELKLLVQCAARGTSAALEVLWQDQGERCTAWHFDQVKKERSNSLLNTLVDIAGVQHNLEDVTTGAELSSLVEEYYSSDSPYGVYRPVVTDMAAQDRLLHHISRKLSAEQASAADGPNGDGSITIQCVQAALKECANGKSPGRDGLPYEVYKVLSSHLLEHLVRAANDVFFNGTIDASFNEGVISLIYKGKGLPKDHLSSHRPITLLNCDNKIIQKIIVGRLHQALDFLIDPAQTAFIRGRDITDNVLLQQCLHEYLDTSHQPGVILILDIKQAYDRVDRAWLHRCMETMGLPIGACLWTRRLMENSRSRVNINGWLTHDFAVNNGLMQGGPWAPPLWNIQFEPLVAALWHAVVTGSLYTPRLHDGTRAPPVACHADDCKLYLEDLARDAPVALACVKDYEAASGEAVEPAKSKGICMGTHPIVHGVDPVTQANFGVPGDPPITALGVPCTTTLHTARTIVHAKRIGALRHVISQWQPVPLSAVGRHLIAKQVMASMYVYSFQLLGSSTEHLSEVSRAIYQYAARSANPEDATLSSHGRLALLPKAGIACLPKAQGGLDLVDVCSFNISLRAKTLARLFSPGREPWKGIMAHLLGRACPFPKLGQVWAFTALPADRCQGLSENLRDLVQVVRQAKVWPSSDFSSMPVRGLLTLPLYFNPVLLSASGAPFEPPAPLPPDWPMTLGQLAACPPALAADARLAAVTAALPQQWTTALAVAQQGEDALSEHDEWWSLPDASVVVHRAHGAGHGSAFHVLRTGFLLPGAPIPNDVALQPACILNVPKPRKQWTPEEVEAYQSAPHAERHLHRPTVPCLLGCWKDIRVYPAAWTIAGLPLHLYSSAATRLQLIQLKAQEALRLRMPDYAPGVAVRPQLWVDPTRPNRTGLAYLDKLWDDSNQDRRHSDVPPPAWMSQDPLPPRSTRTSAAASASQPTPALQPHQEAGPPASTLALVPAGVPSSENNPAKCWSRLWQAPVSNHVKVFGYRLLHAALPCLGLSCHMRHAQPRMACCPLCPSTPQVRRRPTETYTHLFLDCPSYRPVVEWLLDVFEALTGHRPPADPRVIIADELGCWANAPTDQDHQQLWQALRLLALYHIWEARMSKDACKQTPSAVATAVVHAVRAEMRVQFKRSHERETAADHLPPRVLEMRRLQPKHHSFQVWLASGLCSVSNQHGYNRVNLALSTSWPVPLPGLEGLV